MIIIIIFLSVVQQSLKKKDKKNLNSLKKVTLDHKTSLKCQFLGIEINTSKI